jgi:hypothetical protein
VDAIAEKSFPVYKGRVRCGNLTELVTLYPTPDQQQQQLPSTLTVVGFLKLSQVTFVL